MERFELSEDFDRARLRCNVSVDGLRKRYGLSPDEAKCATTWIDGWYDDSEYFYAFFNTRNESGRTGFEGWLEEERAKASVDMVSHANNLLSGVAAMQETQQAAKAICNVLLVDDDHFLRAIIADTLRARGYAVMTARDGQDAYAQWLATPNVFDVVVSDYHMPGMYGDTLRKRIFELCDEAGTARPGFVIMSGAWAEAVSAAGGFIAKPFDPADLHAAIQAQLANRRAA